MCEVYGDSDGPAFYDQRWRRARKQHECDSCKKTIEPGERYGSESYCQERGDRPYREVICAECHKVRETFSEAHGGEIYPLPSYLDSTLVDCIADDMDSKERWSPVLEQLRARRPARP